MEIDVTKVDKDTFQVVVREGRGSSRHRVTLSDDYYSKLAGISGSSGISGGKGISKEELIKKSFQFLLEHEPKESILSSFDLTVIKRYFPDFEREVFGKRGKQ